MNVNLPVWRYYPKNNEKFLDPLYVPYRAQGQSGAIPGDCSPNPYSSDDSICSDLLINKGRIRKGWGNRFQLQHPMYDSCPKGWKKEGNWCVEKAPNYGQHGMYSEDSFMPKYQYFNGYAAGNSTCQQVENEFQPLSVNPYTGDFVMYNNPLPYSNNFQRLPSKDSFLA